MKHAWAFVVPHVWIPSLVQWNSDGFLSLSLMFSLCAYSPAARNGPLASPIFSPFRIQFVDVIALPLCFYFFFLPVIVLCSEDCHLTKRDCSTYYNKQGQEVKVWQGKSFADTCKPIHWLWPSPSSFIFTLLQQNSPWAGSWVNNNTLQAQVRLALLYQVI